jgi:hypothetical protein
MKLEKIKALSSLDIDRQGFSYTYNWGQEQAFIHYAEIREVERHGEVRRAEFGTYRLCQNDNSIYVFLVAGDKLQFLAWVSIRPGDKDIIYFATVRFPVASKWQPGKFGEVCLDARYKNMGMSAFEGEKEFFKEQIIAEVIGLTELELNGQDEA